ncbi:MAG: CDP-diacylglycerol--glycerol-3-phosphate 3-phosphatidyltransferase [Clostridia bacterium]|nr:CDP-diacylglycerol--glycerol-3-phosphate 3-phosphatidyltransferase [Clostridia bacterium]
MNIANRITLIRISMIPVFIFILLSQIPNSNYIAAAVFLAAAGTDGLDGYLARARKEVTNLGKFLDPLADKLLITSALIYLVELGYVAAWITIIIVAREFAVTGLRTIAVGKGEVIAASSLGKLKTIFQVIAVTGLLLQDLPFFFSVLGIPITEIILYTAVILTVISGIDYFIKVSKVFENP